MFEVISKMFLPSILVVIMLTILSIYKKRQFFQFAKRFGGPTFYPLIGNIYGMIGKDVFTSVNGLHKKYSLPCNMWVGHDYTYITDRATEINIVLNHPKCFDKANTYQDFNQILGNSILLLDYDTWKPRRKHFSKSFSQKILRSNVPIIYRNSVKLLNALEDIKEDTNRFHIFERYSFDVFCETNIGVDIFDNESARKFMECISGVQVQLGTRILQSYIPLPIWKLTKPGRRLENYNNWVRKFIFKILQDKREKLKANNEYLTDTLPLADSMLHSEGTRLSNDDVFDELFLFCVAATDTSGCTLAYTFMLLGMHLKIQDKLYEEIMEVVGDREICHEDLPSLKYTECVIQEAMRLIPVTPFLGRIAREDIDLGDIILPKNSSIGISTFHVQRNEKYWKDPLKFDPDRFSQENISKIVPGSYVPFSDGIRNCIGKTYAMMAMKVAVASVVRHFHISSRYKSIEELNFTSCLTMKTTHNLDCDFTVRNK